MTKRKRIPHSPETIQKMRNAKRKQGYKRIFTAEWKRNMSKARKRDWKRGRVHSKNPEETRRKLREKIGGDRNVKWLGKDIIRVCNVCEKVFSVRPNSLRRHCSRRCTTLGKKGKFSRRWRGDLAKYHAMHQRVFRMMGHPTHCIECGKKGQIRNRHWTIHWSNNNHDYKCFENFVGRCAKCHARYDKEHFGSRLQNKSKVSSIIR